MTTPSRSRGFTLIELLVVIAIIGLLSSIVLASLSTAREKARDASRLSDMRALQNALELYRTSNPSYPPAIGNGSLSALQVLVDNGYLPSLPDDPQSDDTTPTWFGGDNHYYYWNVTPNGGNCPPGGPDAYYIFFHTETAYNGDPPGTCLAGTNRHARRMPK